MTIDEGCAGLQELIETKQWNQAFRVACGTGHSDMALSIVDNYISEKAFCWALHDGWSNGHALLIDKIIEHMYRVNHGLAVFIVVACRHGYLHIAKLLFTKSNTIALYRWIRILEEAVQYGRPEVVRWVVDTRNALKIPGRWVDHEGRHIYTDTLSLCHTDHHVEIVQILLENGADPNSMFNENWYMREADEEDAEPSLALLKLIVKYGANNTTIQRLFDWLGSHWTHITAYLLGLYKLQRNEQWTEHTAISILNQGVSFAKLETMFNCQAIKAKRARFSSDLVTVLDTWLPRDVVEYLIVPFCPYE